MSDLVRGQRSDKYGALPQRPDHARVTRSSRFRSHDIDTPHATATGWIW
jgi:hypothetical protein